MKKPIVHMIGQAHLDPVWMWRWTEGRAEALATSQSAVERLHEYPDFHFTRGEAQVYQWIEKEDPELFSEIKNLIRQERWHVVNGMVIQPDMNQPQGESFVRHFLLGKTYMREHLGVEPRVAYCVDSFGHAGTLPQIFQGCGFDAYIFMRPSPHEKSLPAQAFWWEAPDGSRVLAFRITASYGSGPRDHTEHILHAVTAKPPQLSHTMCFFGVGNHGGGPTKQQIENVQSIAQTHQDMQIKFSSPEAYFNAVLPEAETLPIVTDELQFHAVGCYSANSALKRTHRQAECALLTAERMAVMAELWADTPAPREDLRSLWHDVCFNQFHDILGGCSIKEAEDEAIMAFGRVTLGAREIINDAGRAIAARIDTRGPGGAVILFNPFPYTTTQYVEYEPWTGWQNWDKENWSLVDEEGHPIVHQGVEAHDALSTSHHGINRLVFRAEIPPLGYRLYRFAPDLPKPFEREVEESAPWEAVHATQTTNAYLLENGKLRVYLDPKAGTITSCVDKENDLELVGSMGWNIAQVLEDTSDTWSHDVRGFDKVIGHFTDAKVTICDDGPLQSSLLVERTYEDSTWLQQLILRQSQKELLIRNWLFWHGRWKMVKLAFAVPTDTPHAIHDVPFGWLQRPCNGEEFPTQMWMDVNGRVNAASEQQVGLAIIDDGKYGCDVKGNLMRLTILRSPPYAYHRPHTPGSKQRYDWIDQGPQAFTLVLRPHTGDWREAGVIRRAREVNLPIVPITMHGHTGELALAGSIAKLSSATMELTALKPAEDGDGYIIRIVDRHGRGGKSELHWIDQTFPLSLTPFEVVTLRLIKKNDHWQAIPCDMTERPLQSQ